MLANSLALVSQRPHHEIEDSDSSGQPEPAWRREGPSTPYRSVSGTPGTPLNLPHIRQMRLPGYDYRRPIMSTGIASRNSPLPCHPPHPRQTAPPQDDVIDLTEESDQPATQAPGHTPRHPRFGRDIMADVVDLESGEHQPAPNSSPEVQFMGASSLPRSPQLPQPIEPEVQGSAGLGLGSNDEIFPHPRPNNRDLFAILRRSRSRGRGEHPMAREIRLRNRHFAPIFHQDFGGLWLGTPPQNLGVDLTLDIDEEEPVQVTYARPMAPPATQPASTTSATTTSPVYTAPAAAPEGFVRNPDNITVCPNCDAELGTGDDPARRQIWVSKPCGHVRQHFPSVKLIYVELHTNLLVFFKGILRAVHKKPCDIAR